MFDKRRLRNNQQICKDICTECGLFAGVTSYRFEYQPRKNDEKCFFNVFTQAITTVKYRAEGSSTVWNSLIQNGIRKKENIEMLKEEN